MAKGKNSEGGNKGKQGRESPAQPADTGGNPAHSEDPPGHFPIVAIGASAGGLSALEALFGAVPSDSGMAYVVIQHLAPTQSSMLTELLGRSAAIPVVEATEGIALRPDHVYVIPPNHYMSVTSGQLRLSRPPAGQRLPVDFFLRALAVDQHERAFAVILSGTGSDGTLGVQAVKGEGGLVVVQQPRTADYKGMPESAIETGQADFLLPPDEIPGALMSFARQSFGPVGERVGRIPAERTRDLSVIFSLLRGRTGHDFSLYKASTIVRRIKRRMAVYGVEDYSAYVRILRERQEELDKLYQELLIRVSSFFRDAEAFAALEQQVIPKLFDNRHLDQPIRVWVPGCSTGEEAYSIAILLQEAMDSRGTNWPIQLFATDIDQKALDVARAGVYPASIAADVTPARLQRFFTQHGDQYEVDSGLRQMLIFAEQSVVRDPPFSRLDLVSCRNLLIYLGPELQRRVLPLLHYALNADGYLFLGTSETIGSADDLFKPVDRVHKLYIRRDDSVSRAHLFGVPVGPRHGAAGPPAPIGPHMPEKVDVGELADRAILRDFTPAFIVVDRDNRIVHFHGRTGRFLEPPSGAPTLDVMEMAKDGVRSGLRTVIHRARKEGGVARSSGILLEGGRGSAELVRFAASPLSAAGLPEGLVLIRLEELGPVDEQQNVKVVQVSEEEGDRVTLLEQELAHTKEALQATIEELETANEELQSSNEELQSSNEELQSSNEELETSREELQSVNEELHTVNAELEGKVEQLSRTNDDMNNLLGSIDLGIIFLDSDLRIQRFTVAAKRLMPLIDSDIGRPLDDLAHNLNYDRLPGDVRGVIRDLAPVERRIRDSDGHSFLVRIRPYRTSDDRVDGAVLAFVDMAQEVARKLRIELEEVLAQLPTMAMLLDPDGNPEYVNDALALAMDQEPGSYPVGATNALGLDAAPRAVRDAALGAIRAGKSWQGEISFPRAGNDPLRTVALFTPVQDEDGNLSHALVHLHEPNPEP